MVFSLRNLSFFEFSLGLLSPKYSTLPLGYDNWLEIPPAIHFLSWSCVPPVDFTNLEGKAQLSAVTLSAEILA